MSAEKPMTDGMPSWPLYGARRLTLAFVIVRELSKVALWVVAVWAGRVLAEHKAPVHGILGGLLLLIPAFWLNGQGWPWLAIKAADATDARLRAPTLVLPPGNRARSWLARLLPEKTMERYVEPLLADVVHEWQEAMIRGDERHATWIRWRGYLCLAWMLGRLALDKIPFLGALLRLAGG